MTLIACIHLIVQASSTAASALTLPFVNANSFSGRQFAIFLLDPAELLGLHKVLGCHGLIKCLFQFSAYASCALLRPLRQLTLFLKLKLVFLLEFYY